jgi:hypothetical protein
MKMNKQVNLRMMLCVKINGEQFMETSNIFLITCQAQGASLTIRTLLHKIMQLSTSQKTTTSPCTSLLMHLWVPSPCFVPFMFEILCLLMTLFIFNLQRGNQILKQIPCKNLIVMFQSIKNLVLKKAFK